MHTLFKSKVWYALPLISHNNEDVAEWANKFLYGALKILFRIKGNPSRESMFQICFGKKDGIIKDECTIKKAKFLLKFDEEERKEIYKKFVNIDKTGTDKIEKLDDQNLITIIKKKGNHWKRVKALTKYDAKGLIKWQIGYRLVGFGSLNKK